MGGSRACHWRTNLCYGLNAIGAFAAWSLFEALVQLALILVYFSPVKATSENAATGCLVVMLIVVVANLGLDVTLLDRFTRWQFFTYIFEALAMGCVLFNRNVPGSRNTILTIVVLVVSCVAVVLKIASASIRQMTASREGKEKTVQVYPLEGY